MEVFAGYYDLEDRWRPLSATEQERATVLLGDAVAILRSLSPDIDDRTDNEAIAVACSMVKRVMQGPVDMDGVTQSQQTAGPFSQGVSFANPSGDLYVTKFERKRLGIGQQRAFTVDLVPDDESSSSSSSSSS